VHNLKEVTKGQLQSAARYFMKNTPVKNTTSKAEKQLLPLANIFIREEVVIIWEGTNK